MTTPTRTAPDHPPGGRAPARPPADPQPPGAAHDDQAERHLLAAAAESPQAYPAAAQLINAAAFHRPAHQAIWQAIATLHDSGRPCDWVLVADQLRAAGEGDALKLLPDLTGLSWVASTVTWHARIVARAATRRHTYAAAVRVAQATHLHDPATFRDELEQAGQRLAQLARAWDATEAAR